MKKKIVWAVFLLFAAACAVLWFAASVRSFDQIRRAPYGSLDCEPGSSLTVVPSGVCVGDNPEPVSWEGGRNDRVLFRALRGSRYLVLPGLFAPPAGGTAIYELLGCTSACFAYWADGLLWLPTENGNWRPCLPLTHSAQLRDTIDELAAQ